MLAVQHKPYKGGPMDYPHSKLAQTHGERSFHPFKPWRPDGKEFSLGILELPCFVLGRQSLPTHIWYHNCRSNTTPDQIPSAIEAVSGLPRSLIDIFSAINFGTVENDFWDCPGELGSFDQSHLWEAY